RRNVWTLAALVVVALGGLGLLVLLTGASQDSEGVSGLYGDMLAWVQTTQWELQGSLLIALREGAEDWLGVGLSLPLIIGSFIYGVVHAIGPGHGKVVVSAYAATEETRLKRVVGLSLFSAFLQGVTAVVLVGGAYLVLGLGALWVTGVAERGLEAASYGAIALVGLWLLWSPLRRAVGLLKPAQGQNQPQGSTHQPLEGVCYNTLQHTSEGSRYNIEDHTLRGTLGSTDQYTSSRAAYSDPLDHHESHGEHHHDHGHHHHDHGHVHGPGCGHSHAHDAPQLLDALERKQKSRASWAQWFGVAFAVGLRPCTGAVMVLIVSAGLGLWLAGVVATFAMAIGTGLTVTGIASLTHLLRGPVAGLAREAQLPLIWAGLAVRVAGGLFLLFIGGSLFLAALDRPAHPLLG
ncbi:MAG: nickel/cobalt transporter, partial [Rhodospirillaceae bacterium]